MSIEKDIKEAHDILNRDAIMWFKVKNFLGTLESSTPGLRELKRIIDEYETYLTETLNRSGGNNERT